MRTHLPIAAAQPPCLAHDLASNVIAHAAAILAAEARVVVFPELSLTGYELDASPVDAADSRLIPIVDACRDAGAVALVGAPVQSPGGGKYIAMLAANGLGIKVAYRKVWVADSEAGRFSPGPAPAVLDVDGWRLGLAICRDTGIQQHQSDTAALGIDAYVGGTLMHDWEADVQDERGSRIAKQHNVWVAFASFAGSTGEGYADAVGRSAIWTPTGAVAAQAGPEPGGIARAMLVDRAG